MRKIKTKIVLTLLPVLAVFLLYSCQSEFEEGYQPTQNITVKEFTFKQASKQQKFSTAMTKFDIGVKKSKSGRKVIDTDFVIDSATVKQVIASGQTTYTMAIKRANANQDFFENLIIQVKNGDSTRAYIAKYTSSQEMVFNEEHQSYGFQGAVETKEIDFDTTSYGILGDDYVLCVDAILCDQGGSTHIAGGRCANTYCGTYCVTPQSGGGSSSNTGGGGSYSNTGNSTYGNYSNGSNGGSSGQTGIFTAPVVPTYTSVNLTTELLLNQEQQAWVNNPAQFKIKKALQIYLFNNSGVGSQNNEFVLCNNVINHLITNPQSIYTVSNYPGKTEGMPFEWRYNNTYMTQNLKMRVDSNINSVAVGPNVLELLLFTAYPLQALLHVKNSNLAFSTSQSLVSNGTLTHLHNGKGDAFRHAFWNAFDTAQFGSFVTKAFTDAHEWNSNNHALESQMDFFNNQIGINLGQTLSFYSTTALVQSSVLTALYNGDLKYLTPLSEYGDILSTTLIKYTNQ